MSDKDLHLIHRAERTMDVREVYKYMELAESSEARSIIKNICIDLYYKGDCEI